VAEQLLARLDAAGEAAPNSRRRAEAMFLAHTGFVAEHPGVPRMMFGELQRAGSTAPKRMVAAALLAQYAERCAGCSNRAPQASSTPTSTSAAAATLFIGTCRAW
jgi:TetR/AcrR family transcriptional regulator